MGVKGVEKIGGFGAVAKGQKSMQLISANEGLSATPREGCTMRPAFAPSSSATEPGIRSVINPRSVLLDGLRDGS